MRTTGGPADREERLARVHERLVAAVEDPVHSPSWARMLAIAARFPTYSPSNILLIGAQRPDATQVAGIRTWNSLGRRVLKGEHGIAILAPCLYQRRDDEGRTAPPSPSSGSADAERGRRELRGFRVVHVFDVTQTTGDPLPDNGPTLLTGDAPTGLWQHLAAIVQDDEFALSRGPCPHGVNGYTDHARQLVRVRDDVDDAQAVKTLAHELGHIRADHFARFPEYAADRACRGQAEIEAESIAYIVTANAGMPSDQYSVPYVAHWSDGDAGKVRACMTAVVSAARQLVIDRHEVDPRRTTQQAARSPGWPARSPRADERRHDVGFASGR